jgi:hypothetical protein
MKALLGVTLILGLAFIVSGCGRYYGGQGHGRMWGETTSSPQQSQTLNARF